ncbi:MAG: hypothetical protein IKA49_04435 [Alistipes sp.]|nr:hypothetical protein [Alistipes sp.]
MNRRVVAIMVSLVAIASLVFAGSNGLPVLSSAEPQQQSAKPTLAKSKANKEPDYVDMKSDEGWQMEWNGNKIMVVVGNFAAHHNGTVITADSAVRYSERHIECFGRVLINKGSTYIYGDRAEYDGESNEAKVFSKIVKVVDGDATLYTYNFTFNTKTNIGHYDGGGVLISNDNMLESDRGYVYSDNHEIICVERVQMRNAEYDMIADSVVYNTQTDFAQFFTNTNIWNKDQTKDESEYDYLYADRGTFDKAKQLYTITLNGYILTAEQELLSDSLDYYRDSGYIVLKRNIQIDDTTQKMIIFGDWGEYWEKQGNVFMTKEPSVVSYDLSQGDSVFMRSDSMFIYTRYPIREKIEKARRDSLAMVEKMKADSTLQNRENTIAEPEKPKGKERHNSTPPVADLPNATPQTPSNPSQEASQPATAESKTPSEKSVGEDIAQNDSLTVDTTAMSKREKAKWLKKQSAELNHRIKEELKRRQAERAEVLRERNALRTKLLGEAAVRDAQRRAEERRIKDSLKQTARAKRDTLATDSLKQDSLKLDSLRRDSLAAEISRKDSLGSNQPAKDSVAKSPTAQFDTMTVKEVKAYFKAIADRERDSVNKIKQDSLNAKLNRIADARQAKRTAMYKRWERRDSIYNAKAQLRADEQLRRRLARQEKRGIFIQVDTLAMRLGDSVLMADSRMLDSLMHHRLDSIIEILFPKPLPSPTKMMKSDSMNIDSMYREIIAYSRVKMFRSDFQSVCDSLLSTTVDSIIHLYKSPVLWNGASQILSDSMHIITHNNTVVKAEFRGKPLTISQIDTAHYNQITGKEMTSLFRDNQIYRNDVNGNVQTIYYMQEDNSPEVSLMAYIEAGDMTSYIEDQQVVSITYRGNPTYTFYPLDKIPETQITRLPGFKWEAHRRPTQDSVFTRIIRPAQREEKRSLRRPLFPINALLQQRKDDYIRRREWENRTDTLTYETIEWLESLK